MYLPPCLPANPQRSLNMRVKRVNRDSNIVMYNLSFAGAVDIAFPAAFSVFVFLKYMTHFIVGQDIRLGRRQSDLSWPQIAKVATVAISETSHRLHGHL